MLHIIKRMGSRVMRAQKVVKVVIINTLFWKCGLTHPRQFPFVVKPSPKKFYPDPSTPGHAREFLVKPIMITWPALCPAGSTFWNKTTKSQLPINRISSSLFCAASTGITGSNWMQYESFRRTSISKLNFASDRTGRMAGPARSTLIKLSLRNAGGRG